MRDIKRIKPLLALIEEVWNEVPDWRLGQLLVNVSRLDDPFYFEDDVLEEKLKAMLTQIRKDKEQV
jgi:hypothetical protein